MMMSQVKRISINGISLLRHYNFRIIEHLVLFLTDI